MSKKKKIVLIVLTVLFGPGILLALVTLGYLHTTGIGDLIVSAYTISTAETSSQYERGVWFLENGYGKNPNNRYLSCITAFHLVANYEYESAHTALDRALEDRSDSSRTSLLLSTKGFAYGANYQFDTALSYYKQAWAHDSTIPGALLVSARTHVINSNDDSAFIYLKKADDHFPDSPDIAEEIAILYAFFGQKEQAHQWVDRAILSPHAMSSTETFKISLLIADSLYNDAEVRLNELNTGIFTPASEQNRLKAELALRRGDLQAAKTIAEQLCEMMPNSVQSLLLLYSITHDQGDTATALEILDRAYKLDPRNCVTIFYLACNSARDGDTASALDLLQTAVNNGYLNITAIETEEDLASIRQTEQFQNIVTELNERIEKWLSFTNSIATDDLPLQNKRSKKRTY